MKHLIDDLWFILRNWRFFHYHHVLGAELRQWWNDYDQPSGPTTDYSIHIPDDIR